MCRGQPPGRQGPLGQLLGVEDEALRWSCTLTLREDKELDPEKFPEAYRIDKAAGCSLNFSNCFD